ncbi:drug resistance transporter, EmrB/QacA subfamily [Thermoactinomyces sp. DSM 45891]|uniref:MDR family MFS transporter n=1 Tax=Thermoactinomyces sp. DSM 45891 TaxID=1761907 RepID=UPI0009159FD0|nr:MDR family MFS transporter [Thermoactinomyces sp. DSM 45891]SFX77126.1 drug resistance transporter, EmrB/QacA subfamily [Thermoactinomyces sp. DSM 45891]
MEDLSRREKIFIMSAIACALLFASLNQTIVINALPTIVAQLHGAELFNWVFTIYMLTSSITAILVGKLSDLYGRKMFILVGIGFFLITSFLCGTATSIEQLIFYRGLQGIGGGMILSTSFAAVGDLFSPRERGRWQGFLSATFATSSILGPTIGGVIVDTWNWHYIFWVFLPIGFIAFLLISKLFPTIKSSGNKKIDYLGSILLIGTIAPFLLVFSLAGKDYPWLSPQIIGLSCLSILNLVLFIRTEKKAVNPILPLTLFRNKIFTLANSINLLLGMGLFSCITFTPFFLQGVQGKDATTSSVIMIPIQFGLVFASFFTGQILSRTGKYKKLSIFGLGLILVGILSMLGTATYTTSLQTMLQLSIIGLGLGITFPIFSVTIQNAIPYEHLGTGTSSVQLFRQLGGTVGVSVMTMIMQASPQNKFIGEVSASAASNSGLPKSTVKLLRDPQILMNPEQLNQVQAHLTPESQSFMQSILVQTKDTLLTSLHHVYLGIGILILAAFIISFYIPEIELRTSNKR